MLKPAALIDNNIIRTTKNKKQRVITTSKQQINAFVDLLLFYHDQILRQ